ncbi:MAG: substrate-binding domain-containing protein [Fimbriimonas sp.]
MSESNWKPIAAEIAARIESGELAPGSRLPSGDQLATSLGVNRNAAHRAVEELQRQGLVVRRRGSGTVVAEPAKEKGHRIALLVDGYSTYHNFPSGDLLRGIQDVIGEEAPLIIADSKHDAVLESRHLRRLARDTDGILLYATALDRPTTLASLLDEDTPIVAIDRVPSGVEIDSAVTDNFGAAQMAVRTLIERGHRDIGFLSFHKPTFTSVAERLAGYQAALAEAGIPNEELLRWLPEGIYESPTIFNQLVRDTITALRHGRNPATAIFCVEDALGCAAVAAGEQLEISLPDELEIATFHDWHPMTLRTPWNVHRLVQRKYEMGQAAASLLLDRIANPGRPAQAVRVAAGLFLADAGLQESFVSMTL